MNKKGGKIKSKFDNNSSYIEQNGRKYNGV